MVNEYFFNRDVQTGIGYDLRISRILREELTEETANPESVMETAKFSFAEPERVKAEDKR